MNEPHNILMQLLKAKDDVKRLEADYRKVCECNEYINGVKPNMSHEKQFNKIYKTCNYHEVRIYRKMHINA